QQCGTAVVVEQLWTGNQRFRLLGQRLCDHGMAVSQTGHAHASSTVDVLLALLIPQARPCTAHDGDTPFGVYPTGVALFEFLYGRHVRSFLRLCRQRVSGGPYLFRPTRSLTRPPSFIV